MKKLINRMNGIETHRLILRKIRVSDAEDMYEYASIEALTEYLLWSPHESLEYTKSFLKFLTKKYKSGEYLDWGIEHKSEKKLIGTCGFSSLDVDNSKAEIGYVLSPAYQGNGYAAEAVKAVISFAFETLSLNRVEARVMEGNDASCSLLEKLGMKLEGRGVEEIFVKDKFRNVLHYAILKEEYFR